MRVTRRFVLVRHQPRPSGGGATIFSRTDSRQSTSKSAAGQTSEVLQRHVERPAILPDLLVVRAELLRGVNLPRRGDRGHGDDDGRGGIGLSLIRGPGQLQHKAGRTRAAPPPSHADRGNSRSREP